MKKIVFLFLVLITISIAYGQQCQNDGECTEFTFCTDTRKTYTQNICDEGTCSGLTGTWQCIQDSCGAVCDEDTDCGCPDDYCDGLDLIDFPDNGVCGNSAEESCLCQVDTQTGGDCEPQIIENHPSCVEQVCEAEEYNRICVSEGNAEVFYEWNLPGCGDAYSEIAADDSCLCQYTLWEANECVDDGFREYERNDLSGHEYCTDIIEVREDNECSCETEVLEEQCIQDGYSEVTYTWNYGYCGQDFSVQEPDDACLCVYSDWQYNECVDDGLAEQSRTQVSDFIYCLGPYGRFIGDAQCDCQSSEYYRECVGDGDAEVSYEWNFGYCGEDYVEIEPDENCGCLYTGWVDDECASDGIMSQVRDELTGFFYCTEPLGRDISDQDCSCMLSEANRMCSSDGYAQVDYEWNYGYCGQDFSQEESDNSCACTYSSWENTQCISHGFVEQIRYETSGLPYCEDEQFREVPLLSCACRDSESGRVCVSDGFADVTYGWNYDYCGSEYVENTPDASCSCIYGEWQDDLCAADGVREQYREETSDFNYCDDTQNRQISDAACSCQFSEYDRICVEDGLAEAYYEWNFGYCGSSFAEITEDLQCSCVYSMWENEECISFNTRRQSRFQLSDFGYCNDPLVRAVDDEACYEDVDENVCDEITGFCILPEPFEPRIWMDPNTRILLDDYQESGDISDGEEPLVERVENYAFTGEQIFWQVFIWDKNGIEKVDDVYVRIADSINSPDYIEANCRESDQNRKLPAFDIYEGEELIDEWNPDTMRWYDCLLTVEPQWHGSWYAAAAVADLSGSTAVVQEEEYWFFNPVIALGVTGQIEFQGIRPGSVTLSQPLRITNNAEPNSGVMLDMYIAGEDFFDSANSGAACPDTNKLALENIRYYASKGSYNTCQHSNKDGQCYVGIPYFVDGAGSPQNNNYQRIIEGAPLAFNSYPLGNVLSPGSDIVLNFKLSLPEPCTAETFDQGQIRIFGEAV